MTYLLDTSVNVRYNLGLPPEGGRAILPVRRHFNPAHRREGRSHVQHLARCPRHVALQCHCPPFSRARFFTPTPERQMNLPTPTTSPSRRLRFRNPLASFAQSPAACGLASSPPPKTNPIKPNQNPFHTLKNPLSLSRAHLFLQNKPILPRAIFHFVTPSPCHLVIFLSHIQLYYSRSTCCFFKNICCDRNNLLA